MGSITDKITLRNAIWILMKNDISDELVISSPGIISREIYNIRDRPENFYVMGSMGSSLGIGIGLALSKSDREIIVIAGDGDILMSLGTLVLMRKLNLPNLKLIILDNNSYATTGGQRTCSDAIDFTIIGGERCIVVKVLNDIRVSDRIDIDPEEIMRRFYNVCNSNTT